METIGTLIKVLRTIEMPTDTDEVSRLPPKIFFLSPSSKEVIESIKSFTEWMGRSISTQFYSFGESAVSFNSVICINSLEELRKRLTESHILIATDEDLNGGLIYNEIPHLFGKNSYDVILLKKNADNCFLSKVMRSVLNSKDLLEFGKVERQIKHAELINEALDKITDTNEKIEQKATEVNKYKLFRRKTAFPAFACVDKRVYGRYGRELSFEELKNIQELTENKDKNTCNLTELLNSKNLAIDKRSKLQQFHLSLESTYSETVSYINIASAFYFYPVYQPVDEFSRNVTLAKANFGQIVYLGTKHVTLSDSHSKLLSIEVLNVRENKTFRFAFNSLPVNYSSNLLKQLTCLEVDDYGKIYFADKLLLHLKKERTVEITEESTAAKVPKGFFTSKELNLYEIKSKLEELTDLDLFVVENEITDSNNSFSVEVKENQLVLKGTMKKAYLQVRKAIYRLYSIND